MTRSLLILLVVAWTSHAFIPSKTVNGKLGERQAPAFLLSVSKSVDSENVETDFSSELNNNSKLSRRAMMGNVVATSVLTFPLLLNQPSIVHAEEEGVDSSPAPVPETSSKGNILVLGGTRFVGSQVVQTLTDLGYSVTSTSRDGRDGTVALNFATESEESILSKIGNLAKGCSAVISCVGAIGTPDDEVVNSATALAAQASKQANVKRFVYITVAPEVKDFAEGITFLKGYMTGKSKSRQAVLDLYGEKGATLIEPTFIYGGGSFELNPPRVASFYGQFIEGLLSSSPIRTVERALSPGIIKIALEPPVPVEAVAGAAVAGALGKLTVPFMDTYDKIKQASEMLQEA